MSGDYLRSAFYFVVCVGIAVAVDLASEGRVDASDIIAYGALWWGIRAWVDAQKGPTP